MVSIVIDRERLLSISILPEIPFLGRGTAIQLKRDEHA